MSPSVPLVDVTGRALEMLQSMGARVPDLYRALNNQPALLERWISFAWGLRTDSTTPRAMRELMILRSAQLHGAAYQWDDHVRMAVEAGVSQAQINALGSWPESSLFDKPTRRALTLTEEMIEGQVSDQALEDLAQHFEPGERVELILTAAFYCMVPRVLGALRLGSDGDE